MHNLLDIMATLREKEVAFRSITEQMDTTTPHGEMLFQLFGTLAQYERALIKERVVAGLEAAKRRGKRGGRPRVINEEKMEAIIKQIKEGVSKASICRTFGIKPSTLYDALNRQSYLPKI